MRPLSPADAVGGIDKAKAAVLSGGKADGCAPCKQDQQWGRFGFENTPSVHQILRQAAACSGVSQVRVYICHISPAVQASSIISAPANLAWRRPNCLFPSRNFKMRSISTPHQM
jgi:hypothetical protein